MQCSVVQCNVRNGMYFLLRLVFSVHTYTHVRMCIIYIYIYVSLYMPPPGGRLKYGLFGKRKAGRASKRTREHMKLQVLERVAILISSTCCNQHRDAHEQLHGRGWSWSPLPS